MTNTSWSTFTHQRSISLPQLHMQEHKTKEGRGPRAKLQMCSCSRALLHPPHGSNAAVREEEENRASAGITGICSESAVGISPETTRGCKAAWVKAAVKIRSACERFKRGRLIRVRQAAQLELLLDCRSRLLASCQRAPASPPEDSSW